MKPGKTLLFVITAIVLVLVSACSNPFLQESVNSRNNRNSANIATNENNTTDENNGDDENDATNQDNENDEENGDEESNIGPGSGTADDSFLVSTVDDLLHVGNPEPDTKYAEWGLDKYYKQTDDIDLVDVANWTPIGSFTGSYDGDGHKIMNLTIAEYNKSSQGLFSNVGWPGVVKNLGLVDININITGNGNYIGGLAGNSTGTIQNCYVSGSISGYDCVGGIVGRNYLKMLAPLSVIQNCYAVCEISADSIGGGIVGINRGIVQNCYAAGSVSAIGVSAEETDVGGVAGNSYGSLWNCVALNKSVTSEVVDDPLIGRVVGYSNPLGVENNYAWEGMTLKIGGDDKDPLEEDVDGVALSASDIKDKSRWTNPDNWKTDEGAEVWDFTSTWVWDDTGVNMPSLKNCPALPWPAYLQ